MNYVPGQRRRTDPRVRRKSFSRKTRLIILFIGLALLLAAAVPFLEPLMLETERVDLICSSLPSDINHLHIVYLSDIHWGYYFSDNRLNDLVRRINALKPDIVLLGGDYATDSESAIRFFGTMPKIHARYAICAVPGKSDRTQPASNRDALIQAIRNTGIIPLFNQVETIRIGNSSIRVAGIDDYETGVPDIEGVAAQCRQSEYVIFLSHSPNALPDVQTAVDADGHLNWIDLGLFGSTHGGQLAIGGDLLGIAKVPDRYRGGWLQENRVDLLVSRGVGTSVLPARFLRRPQIHDIYVSTKASSN